VSKRPPNFLITGAGESGTSWLYGSLAQHPQVYLPTEMRPEPHYFYKSWEFAKGYDRYLERWFPHVPEQASAIGERSSSYLFGPDVAEHIAKELPAVKLIALLREPVARAFSNWRFSVQSGVESLPFARALRLEADRCRDEVDPIWREILPYAYLGRSSYGEQLERFHAHFPASQLLVLNSDWIKRDEPGALRRVCRFLEVDEDFDFRSPGTFPTSSVRSKRLQRLLRKLYRKDFDKAIERTRQSSPASGQRRRLLDPVLRLNMTKRHPKLDAETRRWAESQLRESMERLRPLVDWDPFDWHAYTWEQTS
jgi:hypothetical protein